VDCLILQRAFDRVCKTVWNMDKKVLEKELHDTDNNGIFDANIPEQEVVQNATKDFVVMTQEQVSNKQKRTSPILSNIKWNKSKRKTPLTAKISSERDVLAFLVERFFLPSRKSFVSSSRLQLVA
jgi:vacuolar-type H+-ATPase subunit H